MESLAVWFRLKNRSALRKAFQYFSVILLFAFGAGIGSVLVRYLGQSTIWVSCALLFIGFIIMIDASSDPFEENVRRTREVVEYAHLRGAVVEAEIGHVGTGSDYNAAGDAGHEGKISCIDGLLSDWIKWQDAPQKYPFNVLEDVLEKMSPPDLGVLKAGVPIRDVVNSREVPTIIHPYGEIPITNVSAGIKRIITLAYLIVWSWHVPCNLYRP